MIELLVVIAVIGILATIIIASLAGARAGGKDSRRISELKQIQYALELYNQTNGRYPCKLYADATVTCELAGTTFMANPPRDPNNVDYSYAAMGSGATCSSYHLGASLEKTTHQVLRVDLDVSAAGTLCTSSLANFHGLSAAAGGTACSVTAGTGQPGGTETCYDLVNQ